VTPRLPATARGPALAAAAVLGLALIAAAPAPLAGVAARAALAAAAVGAAAWLVRRRADQAPPPLVLVGRVTLAREAGLALVEVDGRRLLVGFGAGGTALLARDVAGAGASASISAPTPTPTPRWPLGGRRAVDRSAPIRDPISTLGAEDAR
jgi:flagellar protein FliO/FliZ